MAVYYLDVDDEITSAAARLRDSADKNVALVIQGGSRVATSRINFKLLAGQAHHYNRRLSIVAADAAVRSLAQTAGLPVYPSVSEYQRASSEPSLGSGLGAATVTLPGAAEQERSTGGPDLTNEFLYGPQASKKPGSPPAQTPAVRRAADTQVDRPLRGGRSGSGRRAVDAGKTTPETSTRSRAITPMWIAAALALVLVVGSVSGIVLLPAANIVLTLHTQAIGPSSFTFNVDPGITKPDLGTMSVPALARQFSVAASGTYQATGENVVDTAATGTVTFKSLDTIGAVTVINGTQVSTGTRIAFVTTQTVTVPKATVSGTTISPGYANAPVTAVVKGVSGNVAAGAINRVPSDLAQFQVSVSNPQATSGGSHTVTPFVQQLDIQAAESDLQDQLSAALTAKVSDTASTNQDLAIFDQTASLDAALYEPDPAGLLNDKNKTFELGASAGGTAMAASLSDLQSLAELAMTRKVKAGFSLVTDSVDVSLGEVSLAGGRITLPVTVNALQAPTVDVASLKSALAGKTAAQVKTYLATYGDASVSFWPFWVSTIPGFDFRISVKIVEPPPLPTRTPRPTVRVTPAPPKTAAPTPKPSDSAGPSPTETPTPAPTPTPTPPPSNLLIATPTP